MRVQGCSILRESLEIVPLEDTPLSVPLKITRAQGGTISRVSLETVRVYERTIIRATLEIAGAQGRVICVHP